MAERRMFAKTIIDSDAFLDMPVTSRLLYYDLGMRADDDGFVNAPKKIMRMVGASDDDIKILCARKFLIPFDSGVVVIKHWRINNYLRSDRYQETKYISERAELSVEENGSYTLGIPTVYQRYTNGIPNSGIPSIDKDSKDKNSKDKDNNEASPFASFDENVKKALENFSEMRKRLKKPLTDNAKVRLANRLKELSIEPAEQVDILNQSEYKCWLDIYPLKKDGSEKTARTDGYGESIYADASNLDV